MIKTAKPCLLTLVLLLMFLLFNGCNPNSTDNADDDVCPDSQIKVNELVLSTAIDGFGYPTDNLTRFASLTQDIFASFWIYDNNCCMSFHIAWYFEDEIIQTWQESGPGELIPTPLTVSLNRPPEGFAPGNYKVVLFLDFNELIRAYFTIY